MLRLDLSDFEAKAKELGAAIDQVPFALANALTSAAFRAREVLVEDTWPQHVKQRNTAFIKRSLRVEKATVREYRTSGTLTVAIYDDLMRGNLALHAHAGVRRPHGGRLAIPPEGSVTRGAHGVRKGQKPADIIAKTPKRALRITPQGIFVGEGGRLHLKYAFAPSANIRATVPFDAVFSQVMRVEMSRLFPAAIEKAMTTRKAFR